MVEKKKKEINRFVNCKKYSYDSWQIFCHDGYIFIKKNNYLCWTFLAINKLEFYDFLEIIYATFNR